MGSNEQTVYMIKDSPGGGTDADDWVSPEPADDVITAHILETTDLSADELDELESYVDLEEIRAVVREGDNAEITFTVEGHTVTVTQDGSIVVESG